MLYNYFFLLFPLVSTEKDSRCDLCRLHSILISSKHDGDSTSSVILPTSTYTQHFIFSRTNRKEKEVSFIFKYRTWTPFPTSNPPGKILQSQALLFPLLRRYKEHGETPKLPGEGTQLGETHLKAFSPSNLQSISHCTASLVCVSSLNSLQHLLKRNNRPRWVCPRVVTIPKHTQVCHHRTRKAWLQLPTRTITIFTLCDGIS